MLHLYMFIAQFPWSANYLLKVNMKLFNDIYILFFQFSYFLAFDLIYDKG